MSELNQAKAFLLGHSETAASLLGTEVTAGDEPSVVRWPDPPAPEAYHGLAGNRLAELDATCITLVTVTKVVGLVRFGAPAQIKASLAGHLDHSLGTGWEALAPRQH